MEVQMILIGMKVKLNLMSEANVYGSDTFSSSGFDTDIDNKQYTIFQLKLELINSYGIRPRFLIG